MAIGLVSDEEFEREMRSHSAKKPRESHPIESHTPEIVNTPTRGRTDGDRNVPDSLRKIIGEESVINGRQSALALAEQFGISPSSVSAYAKGATSTTTYNEPKPSIMQHLAKSRERAVKRASSTLNSALSAITQEKLDYADVKDLSGIAKDMSVIIKNLEPQSVQPDSEAGKAPQFVIYAPQFKQESAFDFIDVKE